MKKAKPDAPQLSAEELAIVAVAEAKKKREEAALSEFVALCQRHKVRWLFRQVVDNGQSVGHQLVFVAE